VFIPLEVKDGCLIKINEIFYSIQGESTYAGCPTVFIRTTGCNLRCTYCDTQYSYYDGEWLSLDLILQKVSSFGANYVCITGGEPLLQSAVLDLMNSLCDLGYKLSLETSGSKNCAQVDPRVKIILDIKTPSSGAKNSFLIENLDVIPSTAEIKFVICSDEDLEWAETMCHQYNLYKKFTVLYSPSYPNIDAKWLAEKILQKKSSARLQLQQHKYIWSPLARGI
jgi:7-carboxy-7-deazaguanine synthase